MSLKALARERLAAIRGDETPPETEMKQAKQEGDRDQGLFHGSASCFTPMKQGNPQKTAKNEACFTVSRPKGGNDETRLLPPAVTTGLARLQALPIPRITRPEVWPEIVADALRLVDEGWAQQALALGWQPFHLWGCSPDRGGNTDHDGLAVMLAGRRIVLLDERMALIEAGTGAHALFNVRPMPGAVLLWELGR